MAHSHKHHGHGSHAHSHEVKDDDSSKSLKWALFLNLGFAIIELFGGLATNSVAIVSDALHDFGDSFSIFLALIFEKFGKKAANTQYTYGHRRFSLLAALLNGLILLIGSFFMIKEAVTRLMSGGSVVHSKGMVLLAILGVVVNAVAALKLLKHKGPNQRMVALHLLEDLYGWLGVLAVAIILLFYPWYFLDSIVSIVISIVILVGVYRSLKETLLILMQKFPETLDLPALLGEIRKINHITDIHFVQGWSHDGQEHTLSFHVGLPDHLTIKEMDEIKSLIKAKLKEYQVINCVIEFEGSLHCQEVSASSDF